jgi:hypothetical protein
MKSPRLLHVIGSLMAGAALMSSLAVAQLSVEKVTATNKILQQIQATVSKLPPVQQKMLDGYANINHIATKWQAYGMRLTSPTFRPAPRAAKAAVKAAVAAAASADGGIVPVSDPSTDYAYSAFAGYTQSETSTARCGNTVVVGFNDSGSVFETPYFYTGTGGQSFSGSAYSTDGGHTFTDIGPVNPGPTIYNFLGGDPGVLCTDPNTFYFTQIFDYDDASLNPWAAISINTSTDGGQTWGNPVAAIAKSAFYHLLDKPWSTIDPSNHNRIFVSYTDFDYSGTVCGNDQYGFPLFRNAIEFVESDDGGNTWGAPNVAAYSCADPITYVQNGFQGSQMAVNSTGTLYISWVNLGPNFPLGPRSIQISGFSGGTLSSAVTVEKNVQPGGDSYYLQGDFRDFLDMAMAVDHSGRKLDGAIYITWADGRNKITSDPFAIQGAYADDDVLLRASYDGGQTWGSAPLKVNSDTQPGTGSGHDHYQSGIAVDKHGTVGICWYDRRNDSENQAIGRYCASSNNGGASFADFNTGLRPFAPTHGSDSFINPIYMGDYDQLTSDFLNHHSGFVGAFENQGNTGNPDADAFSFGGDD